MGKLLEKDPEKRPTAEEALGLPWLQGKAEERRTGEPLCDHVIQRIQVSSSLPLQYKAGF